MELVPTPITQKVAFRFIGLKHRHLKHIVGGITCNGISRGGVLVGAAVYGRPVAPAAARDTCIAEIVRTCVIEGVLGGNSKLYRMCAEQARSQGYWKIQTFTLASESGVSLKAAGFFLERPAEDDTERVKGQWGNSRKKGFIPNLFGEPDTANQPKNRWVRILGKKPE